MSGGLNHNVYPRPTQFSRWNQTQICHTIHSVTNRGNPQHIQSLSQSRSLSFDKLPRPKSVTDFTRIFTMLTIIPVERGLGQRLPFVPGPHTRCCFGINTEEITPGRQCIRITHSIPSRRRSYKSTVQRIQQRTHFPFRRLTQFLYILLYIFSCPLNLPNRLCKFFFFRRNFRHLRFFPFRFRLFPGFNPFFHPIRHLTDFRNSGRHFHSSLTFFHAFGNIITCFRSHRHHLTHRQLPRTYSHFRRFRPHHIFHIHPQLPERQIAASP